MAEMWFTVGVLSSDKAKAPCSGHPARWPGEYVLIIAVEAGRDSCVSPDGPAGCDGLAALDLGTPARGHQMLLRNGHAQAGLDASSAASSAASSDASYVTSAPPS